MLLHNAARRSRIAYESASRPIKLQATKGHLTMHPTRALLIKTVSDLLETRNPDEITGQMVLRASRVSHGSLYHHFEDASDLIETVMLDRFFGRVIADIETLKNIVLQTTDRSSYISAVYAVTRDVQQPKNHTNRMQRIHLLSYASSRPRLLKRLAKEQTDLTSKFGEIIEIAKNKGWVGADIDPLAAAVFFQAFTLGRVIDDVSSEHISPDQWNHIVMTCVERIFGV